MTVKSTVTPVIDVEEPLKAEAVESTKVRFTYDEKDYVFDTEDLDDVEVKLAMEEEKIATLIKLILGNRQWSIFTQKKRKSADLDAMAEAMFENVGVSLGE